jgi:hypothetical protein
MIKICAKWCQKNSQPHAKIEKEENVSRYLIRTSGNRESLGVGNTHTTLTDGMFRTSRMST